MITATQQRISQLSAQQQAVFATSLRGRLEHRSAGPDDFDVAILGGGVAHYLRHVIGLDEHPSTRHFRWNYPTLNPYGGKRVSRARYDRGGQS